MVYRLLLIHRDDLEYASEAIAIGKLVAGDFMPFFSEQRK